MKKLFALGILSLSGVLGSTYFTDRVSASQPSTPNSPQASSTIVISQANGGGGSASGTYLYDYVELKNISSSPQSLNGLSLMYGSATGQFGSSASNIYVLPNVTLQPGQFFLVQFGNAGTGGVALPVTPDSTTTNISMSGTSGKMALVTAAFTANACGSTAAPCSLPNAAIIDLVSYGAATNAEGGAPTNGGVALTASQGNVRKGNGCTDTDNNNADFDVVTAPVPHNSSTASTCGTAVVHDAPVDFNGDGKTDFAVIRTDAGAGGQATWYYNLNGSSTNSGAQWGLAGDFYVPADYDGDGKDDIAVWRGTLDEPAFFILQSSNNTVRADRFGLPGDDPRVVGDYDGDGKDDVAVYRQGASAGAPSAWYYRSSISPDGVMGSYWGQSGDYPAPGDYDGDGKNDFCVQRNAGSNQAVFWTQLSNGTVQSPVYFGYATDNIVPGDYDGDGKSDIAIARPVGGSYQWWIRSSQTGGITGLTWGTSSTDTLTPGDYDGDGKTDPAIWRSSVNPGGSAFWAYGSQNGSVIATIWGQAGDYPVANAFVH